MSFTNEQIEALKAPLNRAFVKERSQAGRALSYLEGWKAIDEANRIFGFDKWNRSTKEMRLVCEPYQDPTGKWRVSYGAKVEVRVYAEGETEDKGISVINREGWGYGSGIDKDLGQAHESAIKEAETDAMKRALMTFGNPFGLALYDKDQKNVVDEGELVASALVAALKLSASEAELSSWYEQNNGALADLPASHQGSVRDAYRLKLQSLRQQRAA